jgi:hypothetical protein
MTFVEVLAEQWNGYGERHRNKANLLIHIATVPLVWFAGLQIVGGLLLMLIGVGGLKLWIYAAILITIALVAQWQGNSMEQVKAAPPANPKDFAVHTVAEQFVTFPRFVLSGQWMRNFQAGG